MRQSDLDRVQGLSLFAGVAPETFRVATAGAQLQQFQTGVAVISEGDPADCLHVLLDGQVELHGTWNDRETVISILRPVSAFVLAAVVLGADAVLSARALERCEVLMIPADAIRTAMRLDSRFGMAVSRDLAGAFRGMVHSNKNMKLRNSTERLANYLLSQRADGNSGDAVRLRHEKRVLASLLGMTPENLSRSFAALHPYGVVVNGAVVTLTNIAALEQLAKPDLPAEDQTPRGVRTDTDRWRSEQSRTVAPQHS